jgi:fumarate reductase flavoprotein subunit
MIEAVASAVDQAGGDSKALKEKKREVVKGQDEEITTDIVVVGGGASGTAAALAAAEKGAKVVVLEKGDNPGGAGRYLAEGLLAFESKQQKAAGINYTFEDGFKDLVKYTHYLNNGNLAREILKQSASTIDWLAQYGAETKLMENTQKLHKDNPMTYHKYVDKKKAFENMYAKFKEMGGTIFTNTAGKELIQDKDGSIIGVIAQKADGGKLTVNAKNVILATGGFAGSADMLKKYLHVTNYTTMAYANNTGDGLTMAQAVGADEFNVHVAVHAALIPSKDTKIWQGTAGQLLNLPLMWVNREGKRFVDEGVVYDFALWGIAAVAQGGEYFVVLDDATMKELSEKGSD